MEMSPATLKTVDKRAASSVTIVVDTQPIDQKCFQILKEDIQVEAFLYSEAVYDPNVLFRMLQDYCVLKRVPYITQKIITSDHIALLTHL